MSQEIKPFNGHTPLPHRIVQWGRGPSLPSTHCIAAGENTIVARFGEGQTDLDNAAFYEHAGSTYYPSRLLIEKLAAKISEYDEWAQSIANDERVTGFVHASDYSLYVKLADCDVLTAEVLAEANAFLKH